METEDTIDRDHAGNTMPAIRLLATDSMQYFDAIHCSRKIQNVFKNNSCFITLGLSVYINDYKGVAARCAPTAVGLNASKCVCGRDAVLDHAGEFTAFSLDEFRTKERSGKKKDQRDRGKGGTEEKMK